MAGKGLQAWISGSLRHKKRNHQTQQNIQHTQEVTEKHKGQASFRAFHVINVPAPSNVSFSLLLTGARLIQV